jgi:serine/threonine protein kinase/tetratricopeptide (TPR) repeat protein
MSRGTRDPGWAKVQPHFDRALDLEPPEREAWLAELGAIEPEIAQAVRELLARHNALNADGFMSQPVFDNVHDFARMLHEILAEDPALAAPLAATPGLRADALVGPYRLIREIARGGMSSIWLAAPRDGQLRRQVALKLPFIDPRMQVERFLRERDLLAALTHPQIARLYEAGITSSGQPYLAMEYVEGPELLRSCDEQLLTIRKRLRVFLQVLEPVQFAHASLIIHRDLKPSNILVTLQGRVVLLDFGIGKLLTEGNLPATPLTLLNSRALTLDYASPEQIAGKELGTGSDVYSLGVILYELLTGTRPYRPKRESQAALEEAILSEDLRRPSQTAISDEGAASRGVSPRSLRRLLAGDLDTIVLKALRKTPLERYASVTAFAQDIANYLENLPVGARPDCFRYRAGRFVSRHRVPVIAASVATFALLSGAMLALWQAREAAQERERALTLSSRNEATNEFLGTLIVEAAASETPVTVSDMLARSENLALADASGSSENRAATLSMLASYHHTLGHAERAAQLAQQAVLLVANSKDEELRTKVICQHALMISDVGHHADAAAEIDRSLRNVESISSATRWHCLIDRGFIAKRDGDAQNALRYAQLALEQFHEAAAGSAVDEANILGEIATGFHLNGQNDQASRYFKRAMEKYAEAGRERDVRALALRNNWALVESGSGAPKRALELYEQTLEIMAGRDSGAQPPPALLQNKASALESIGRYDEARAAYEAALQIANEHKDKRLQSLILVGLTVLAERSSDRNGAAAYLDRLNGLLDPSQPSGSPIMMSRAVAQGRLDLMDQKFDAAIDELAQVLSHKKSNTITIDAALAKAEAELAMNDAKSAAADARFALDLSTTLQGGTPYSNRTGLASLMLGRALLQLGDPTHAREALAVAVAHLSNTVDADQPELVRARKLLENM